MEDERTENLWVWCGSAACRTSFPLSSNWRLLHCHRSLIGLSNLYGNLSNILHRDSEIRHSRCQLFINLFTQEVKYFVFVFLNSIAPFTSMNELEDLLSLHQNGNDLILDGFLFQQVMAARLDAVKLISTFKMAVTVMSFSNLKTILSFVFRRPTQDTKLHVLCFPTNFVWCQYVFTISTVSFRERKNSKHDHKPIDRRPTTL